MSDDKKVALISAMAATLFIGEKFDYSNDGLQIHIEVSVGRAINIFKEVQERMDNEAV